MSSSYLLMLTRLSRVADQHGKIVVFVATVVTFVIGDEPERRLKHRGDRDRLATRLTEEYEFRLFDSVHLRFHLSVLY